jgi:hypothetical protein
MVLAVVFVIDGTSSICHILESIANPTYALTH